MKAWLPAPDWLREYQRAWLRGDLLAGVTVTAYLIPQVMAYAELAGLPAVAGLWASVGALLGYALLGSSRRLSVGPESTTALMTAAALGSVPAAAADPASFAAALALVVACFCVLGWLGHLAALAERIDRRKGHAHLCPRCAEVSFRRPVARTACTNSVSSQELTVVRSSGGSSVSSSASSGSVDWT